MCGQTLLFIVIAKDAISLHLVGLFAVRIHLPSVLWHSWLGDRKGVIRRTACKKLDVGLLVVMIWLELCTTCSSSSPVVTTTCIILCFNKHRLTQIHLEIGRRNGERESQITTIQKPTVSFYRPAALPVTHPTVSEHWRQSCILYVDPSSFVSVEFAIATGTDLVSPCPVWMCDGVTNQDKRRLAVSGVGVASFLAVRGLTHWFRRASAEECRNKRLH